MCRSNAVVALTQTISERGSHGFLVVDNEDARVILYRAEKWFCVAFFNFFHQFLRRLTQKLIFLFLDSGEPIE